MRVLVCGGRDYNDREKLSRELDALDGDGRITLVIHGDARGADRLAGEWAQSRGIMAVACPAEWALYGKAAGHKRNAAMLADHKPELVVAFPGGTGTADMTRRAIVAGVAVVTFSE